VATARETDYIHGIPRDIALPNWSDVLVSVRVQPFLYDRYKHVNFEVSTRFCLGETGDFDAIEFEAFDMLGSSHRFEQDLLRLGAKPADFEGPTTSAR
jgi:hypothetical protein